jgi:hypothetical protein
MDSLLKLVHEILYLLRIFLTATIMGAAIILKSQNRTRLHTQTRWLTVHFVCSRPKNTRDLASNFV